MSTARRASANRPPTSCSPATPSSPKTAHSARSRALLARRTAGRRRRGHRAAGVRTPPQHLVPRERRGHGEHRDRNGDSRGASRRGARPRHRPDAVRTQGRSRPQRTLRGDFPDTVARTCAADGSHPLRKGRRRDFGRPGLDARTARDGPDLRFPAPRPRGHHRHHDARIRDHRPHLQQCAGADARTGRDDPRNPDPRRLHAAFSGYRPRPRLPGARPTKTPRRANARKS